MSTRLVDSEWERELRAGIQQVGPSLLFACPFIKESVILRLIEAGSFESMTVVTRFSLRDFASGVSDIGALRVLHDNGADVRGLRDLHAKVFVFGQACAVVTSANLTESGLARNREFGCVSTDRAFIASCDAYVRGVHAIGAPLNPKELDDWQACPRSRFSPQG